MPTCRTRLHAARCRAHRPASRASRLSHRRCRPEGGRIQIEAFHRAFDHAFCGQDLGPPDRGRRLDINDDPVVDIDQVVSGIGEERLTMGTGPSRSRIGQLGHHVGGSTEGSIVERRIFSDFPACRFWRQPFLACDAAWFVVLWSAVSASRMNILRLSCCYHSTATAPWKLPLATALGERARVKCRA